MTDNTADFEFIDAHRNEFPVTQLVLITTVSRSGYYTWKERVVEVSQAEKDKSLLNKMMSLYITHGGNLGNIRFKDELESQYGLIINLKRIRRMRKMYNLPLKTARRAYKRQNHKHAIVGNILNRNFNALKPGIKFVIDITYLEVIKPHKNFIYLCAIKDLYNNEIVAYTIGQYQTMDLVNTTLDKLIEKGFVKGAILHSDQGSQFTNPSYMNRLTEQDLTQSMSRRGNCWDNACIESFFGKLKTEIPGFSIPETEKEMVEAVTDYITYYNEVRPQLKFKASPVTYRIQAQAAA